MRVELKNLLAAFFVSFLFSLHALPQSGADFDYISVNNLKMWVSNYGIFSHDPNSYSGGLFYPADSSYKNSLVYSDGLLWAGKINGELYINGSTHGTGVAPGPVGSNKEVTANKFRVFKVRPDWKDLSFTPEGRKYRKNHEEWPGELGAPYFDLNGNQKFDKDIDLPQIWGDEMLWTIFHDDRAYFSGEYDGGMEVHSMVYAFNSRNLLYDVVFKKYIFINKGEHAIDSLVISQFSDTDLGDGADDYVGCDSSLSLAYCYNARNNDGLFGSAPPAVGYFLVKGPHLNDRINRGSFSPAGENWSPIRTPVEIWNALNGKKPDGSYYINPHDSVITKFPLNGDPYRKTGWYEGNGWPGGPIQGDRRIYLNAIPFTMAPGDTQEVVYAILAARGNSNVHSVELLKNMVSRVKLFYEAYSPKTPEIKEEPAPLYYNLEQNYPNPFNAQTTINYQIPLDSRVTIKVYDILGNEAAVLKDEFQSAGRYRITFDAGTLASGIYFLNISAREFFSTKKMILLR